MMRAGGGWGLAMDDLVGRALGPYELLDRLGAGGMATVYRGVHRALGQPRAIKILLPSLAEDSSLVERFRTEAKIASGLRHPNIVSIYDVGEQDGLFYLVMDLVQGMPLARLLRRDTTLPLDRVVLLLQQLASALDYAHEQGVVHRDIKAGNVMVGEGDHVSLFDFGIARATMALSRLTLPGQVVGTPEYLAPEVISGSEGDRRADYYALGILTYQMLTGRLPFGGGDPMALLYAQVSKAPPPLLGIRPDLPEAVEQVVMRQLAKDPEERYPTAESFVSDLNAASGDQGVDLGASAFGSPRTPPPTRHTPPPARQTPLPRNAGTPPPVPPDRARETLAGLGGGWATPPPPAAPSPFDEEIATPRTIARPPGLGPTPQPIGFDPSSSTIPPESVYRPEPTRRPDPYQQPAPPHTPPGGYGVVYPPAWDRTPPPPSPADWPAQPPVRRTDVALREPSMPPAVPAESNPGPAFGPVGFIVVVALGLVGIWALATGRLESIASEVLGLTPTPTVEVGTRPEPTIVSIVPDPTPSPVAAAPPSAPPPALASPAAAAPAAVPQPAPEPTALAVAQAAPLPPSPEQQLLLAQKLIQDGDHASAVAALMALKESAPDTAGVDDALYGAYVGLGKQQLDQGLLDDSYAAYGEALKLRPDDPAAQDGQKQVVLTKLWNTMETAWGNDDAVATAALEEILALDPGYRDANVKLYALLVARAQRMIDAGDVDGAMALLLRAEQVYPEGQEAPALIQAHAPTPTPAPAPEAAPAQNQAPVGAPVPAPAPKPAPKPAQKPSQKPSLPGLPGLPGFPRD